MLAGRHFLGGGLPPTGRAGVMVASAALAWTLWHLAPSGGPLSAFLALWLSPLLHLPASVGYHLFLCLSPKVGRRVRR